jgi:FMN phosphatase YigB (HAD superfamily)
MKKITTVLFDLDGTLLPMEQEAFVEMYFGLLAKKLAPKGYEPKKLIAGIWSGTQAMIGNDGSKTNEEAFWQDFCKGFGEEARQDMPFFDEFYRKEFLQIQQICGFRPEAAQVIHRLQEKSFTIALATNPIFPAVATENRIRWAGLEPSDFALYTTYENSRFCKPNLAYYEDILAQLRVSPEECLMVGNDVAEDMVAQKLGMEVFLLTDCLSNKPGADIAQFAHGGFPELLERMETL